MNLYEQYRPTTFDQVIAQDKAIAKIREFGNERGYGGSAWWITGGSGTGKTTIARILARELADDLNIEEFDGCSLTADELRHIESTMYQFGGYNRAGKTGRCYIINEAHGMSRTLLSRFLTILEAIHSHAMFIFTTTNDGAESLFEDHIDEHPFLSRCVCVQLARRDLAKPFAEFARRIALAEHKDGKPIEAYVKLAQECKNNLRMMLQRVQAGDMLA